MATAVNPRIVDGTAEEVSAPVAAAQTWSKGAPVYLNSGALTICADGSIPCGLASEDIAAPTTSSLQKYWRFNIGTRVEMYAASGGSSSAITTANVGIAYDLQVIGTGADLVGYVDLGATTDACFRVVDVAQTYEPERHAAADNPGKCIVEIVKVA